MPRARLGVALLVPEPVATEIDGLRRALGDGALGRIPAHLTLVPPVNVALERLEEAEALLVAAAVAGGPLDLELGPAATFWPVTPVVHLAVSGDLAGLVALRERVFRPPLARSLTHAFVPHVTLADDLHPPERIEAATAALADYRRAVRFGSLSLLQEGEGRRWDTISQAPLGPPAVIGRGGLPLEISVGPVAPSGGDAAGFTVTGRRDGEAVGRAELRPSGEAGVLILVVLVVSAHARGTGVGSAVLAAALSRAAEAEAGRVVAPLPGPELGGFLRHRGFSTGSGGDGAVLERRLVT